MYVYLASMFLDKDRVKSRAKELKALGIDCTSSWAKEKAPGTTQIKDVSSTYLQETAVTDIKDILKADKMVLTVPEPSMLIEATIGSASRGGRHFEAGLFYGLMLAQMMEFGRSIRELIVLGKRENIFHYLNGEGVTKPYPMIRVFETWDDVKNYLERCLYYEEE